VLEINFEFQGMTELINICRFVRFILVFRPKV